MKNKTITKFISDYEFESVNESGNVVKIDMYPKDKKHHQSPMELVLSAVAACAAVDLVQMVKKRKKTVLGLTIETEGNRKDDAPKRFTDITMKFKLDSPDTSEEEFEKLVKLAVEKYCSVSSSLEEKVSVNYTGEVMKTKEPQADVQ